LNSRLIKIIPTLIDGNMKKVGSLPNVQPSYLMQEIESLSQRHTKRREGKKIVIAFSQICIYTSSIVNPMLMSSPLSQAVVMDFKGMSRSSENYKENYR
jgi:hypothetical protein